MTLNIIFFLSSPFQVAGLSNGVKREAKDDHSIAEGFKNYVKIFLLQTHHHPISGGEGASSKTLERYSIF